MSSQVQTAGLSVRSLGHFEKLDADGRRCSQMDADDNKRALTNLWKKAQRILALICVHLRLSASICVRLFKMTE
jgi:hypothetical protein